MVTAAVFTDDADALQVAAAGAETIGHSNGHLADAGTDAWVDGTMAVRFHDAACIAFKHTQLGNDNWQLLSQMTESITHFAISHTYTSSGSNYDNNRKYSRHWEKSDTKNWIYFSAHSQ